MKKIGSIYVLFCLIVFSFALYAQDVKLEDLSDIKKTLSTLADGIEKQNLGAVMELMAPDMDPAKLDSIKTYFFKKFLGGEYKKFKFYGLDFKDAKSIAPDKVDIDAKLEYEYSGEDGTETSKGFSSSFVMQKIGSKWYIFDTDIDGSELSLKILLIIIGAGVLVFMLIIVPMIVFWIWMLVDSIKREYKDSNEKVVWVLVIIFAQLLGAIIYYFVVKRRAKNLLHNPT